MALNPVQILGRRVTRSANQSTYVNTLNIRDRVTIDFVWYPGETTLSASLVDTLVVPHPVTNAEREIRYTWAPDGGRSVTRPMLSPSITIALPVGRSGTLTAFNTEWRITRVGAGVNMEAANTLPGIQRRLDRLGYHLRAPGAANPGVDGSAGARTETAVLQFQVDYRPPAGAPAAAANRLQMRGEAMNNTDATYLGNLTAYNGAVAVPNPSTADSAALQAALVAVVGA